MSLATWKRWYYPVEASKATGSKIKAIRYSLRKWTGLLPETLRKHGVKRERWSDITDGSQSLSINEKSCALCVKYHTYEDCTRCPLPALRDGAACDARHFEKVSPFHRWIYTGNPKPMIKLLEAALRKARAEK